MQTYQVLCTYVAILVSESVQIEERGDLCSVSRPSTCHMGPARSVVPSYPGLICRTARHAVVRAAADAVCTSVHVEYAINTHESDNLEAQSKMVFGNMVG
jgi:hypothetical protein